MCVFCSHDKRMRGRQHRGTPAPVRVAGSRWPGGGWLFLNHLCRHSLRPVQCPGRGRVHEKGRFRGEGPRSLGGPLDVKAWRSLTLASFSRETFQVRKPRHTELNNLPRSRSLVVEQGFKPTATGT